MQNQDARRIPAKGYAVFSKDSKFEPFNFTRHSMGENDILIEILYAGICHSDIHSVRSEWREGIYPMVPGHEISGRVLAVGSKVSKFKLGDYAGVGCMVNSCGECEACKRSHEQFCERGQCVFTYNAYDCFHNSEVTYGGYSNNIVVSEKFAIQVPINAPLEKVGPLLCAGITTYSPLKFSNVQKGQKVAIAGFGGLGSMAVKYSIELGAEVSVIARSERKKQEAFMMGISNFYSSLKDITERFDLIINTIPTKYNIKDYLKFLKYGGEMAIVGLPPKDIEPQVSASELVYTAGRKVYGSLIGGIKETQEMLDFSIKHNIYPEVELVKVDQIDEVYEKLTTGNANFRYVIDMKTLK